MGHYIRWLLISHKLRRLVIFSPFCVLYFVIDLFSPLHFSIALLAATFFSSLAFIHGIQIYLLLDLKKILVFFNSRVCARKCVEYFLFFPDDLIIVSGSVDRLFIVDCMNFILLGLVASSLSNVWTDLSNRR